MRLAGGAVAFWIDRVRIRSKARVLDVQNASGCKEQSMSTIACRDHAVKKVDPLGHAIDQVDGDGTVDNAERKRGRLIKNRVDRNNDGRVGPVERRTAKKVRARRNS